MKKILIALSSVLLLTVITACSTASKEDKISFNVKAVGEEIIAAMWGEGMSFEDSLEYHEEIDESKVSAYYGMAGSMIDSNRLIIVEAKDIKDIEEIKTSVEKIQTNLISSFEQYLPAPLVIAKDSEVIVKGKYVFFISHAKKADAIAIFEKQFTK